MAQLSRPYQIGLVAVAVLAAAWLLLLQGHHSSTSGSASSSSAPAVTAHAPAKPAHPAHAAAGQATGSGSASSLGALGHDIEKARGAVATSKRNAQELGHASAKASTPNSSSSSKTSAPSATHAGSAAPSATSTTTHAPAKSPAKGVVRAAVAPRQHLVEAQLAAGRTVLIFFWNPKGSDDRSTNQALSNLPHGNIAIDRARANAVATFGTITRGVQVFGTPTLLVLNRKGQVTTLTGLQDTYTIAQAIREARRR